MPHRRIEGQNYSTIIQYMVAKDRQNGWPSADNIFKFIILMKIVYFDSNLFPMVQLTNSQGAVSIRKTVLPGMAIPMLKIRRPNGRLIFNMEIAIRR